MNYQQQLANSAAIRAEIQRFESVHPNIYSIYELLERVEEPVLQNQIREHVIAIEGETAAPARRGEGASGGGCPKTSSSPWPCAPQNLLQPTALWPPSKPPQPTALRPPNLLQPTALLPRASVRQPCSPSQASPSPWLCLSPHPQNLPQHMALHPSKPPPAHGSVYPLQTSPSPWPCFLPLPPCSPPPPPRK